MQNYPIVDATLRWLEAIFSERYGHAWHLSRSDEVLRLQLEGEEGVIVFDKLEDCLTKSHSDQPCTFWDPSSEDMQSPLGASLPLPGLVNLPDLLIESRGGAYIIHYDIPGLIYWMLARVEEIGRSDLDNHNRFIASSSHAYKHGYLDRPVVDEWLHVLGQVIQRQWPSIDLKHHKFNIRVSHDVDRPSMYTFKPWKTILRTMAGHVLKRRDFKAFLSAPYIKLATRYSLIDADPYNTFDWLMDISEANNLKSAFYFICGRTHPINDAEYDLDHLAIRSLLRRIHNRGHEIGLHPSYNTFKDHFALKCEADRLKRVCAEEGIEQDEWGGRMHYLRWTQPSTMRAWADAGMTYDSTLGYADHAGFRCGTCYEYPAFDAERQEEIGIRIRPLVAMEGSVINDCYMGLGNGKEAENIFLNLKEACYRVNGCFTLLWHNSSFINENDKMLYCSLLDQNPIPYE